MCDDAAHIAVVLYAVHPLILLIYPSELQAQKVLRVAAVLSLRWGSRAVMGKKGHAGLRVPAMMGRRREPAIADY